MSPSSCACPLSCVMPSRLAQPQKTAPLPLCCGSPLGSTWATCPRRLDVESEAPLGLDPDRLALLPNGRDVEVVDPEILTREQYHSAAAITHTFRATEYGNAQRLAALFGQDLRWVDDARSWYVWNGRHWAPDVTGELMRRAKTVARLLWWELPLVDDHERPTWFKHAKFSETKRGLQSMIDLAASEKIKTATGSVTLSCSSDDFDTDRDLLNCPNGTLNLVTGLLSPHRRDDMQRRMTLVPYARDATSADWEQFLLDCTGHDEDLVSYLQVLAGATLLGTNRHDLVPVIFGPPASGKSTFIRALLAPLGRHYGDTASLETFAERRASSSARDDLARMEGLRMVACVEGERNHMLAVGLVKQISGGDDVTARRLYMSTRTWRPEMTVWIAVNERPRMPQDEEGMWRRVKAIPFENQVPVVDHTLRDRLSDPQTSGAAVLAWAVEGARRLAAMTGPLVEPSAVVEAIEEYREEQGTDELTAWLDACCETVDDRLWTSVEKLRTSYERWCEDTGVAPQSGKAWGTAMGHRFKRGRRTSTRFYLGVQILTDEPASGTGCT